MTNSVAERLIVAADFKPGEGGALSAVERALRFSELLAETGVVLKLNSVLRAGGYNLLTRIHEFGVRTFADLKLVDIGSTMENDGALLNEYRPLLVTAMCKDAGVEGLSRLQAKLPNSNVLGVTVLTSQSMSSASSVAHEVYDRAAVAYAAGLAGIICAPTDLSMFKDKYENFEYVTPNIRPTWAAVQGDDQNKSRGMTPADAIRAGATRLVIGRPITGAVDPKAAVKRILEEINSAL